MREEFALHTLGFFQRMLFSHLAVEKVCLDTLMAVCHLSLIGLVLRNSPGRLDSVFFTGWVPGHTSEIPSCAFFFAFVWSSSLSFFISFRFLIRKGGKWAGAKTEKFLFIFCCNLGLVLSRFCYRIPGTTMDDLLYTTKTHTRQKRNELFCILYKINFTRSGHNRTFVLHSLLPTLLLEITSSKESRSLFFSRFCGYRYTYRSDPFFAFTGYLPVGIGPFGVFQNWRKESRKTRFNDAITVCARWRFTQYTLYQNEKERGG